MRDSERDRNYISNYRQPRCISNLMDISLEHCEDLIWRLNLKEYNKIAILSLDLLSDEDLEILFTTHIKEMYEYAFGSIGYSEIQINEAFEGRKKQKSTTVDLSGGVDNILIKLCTRICEFKSSIKLKQIMESADLQTNNLFSYTDVRLKAILYFCSLSNEMKTDVINNALISYPGYLHIKLK